MVIEGYESIEDALAEYMAMRERMMVKEFWVIMLDGMAAPYRIYESPAEAIEAFNRLQEQDPGKWRIASWKEKPKG